MAISLETTDPLPFNEWVELQNTASFTPNYNAYLDYLKLWYSNKKTFSSKKTLSLRENYIELIKNLTYFFTTEEKELFLNGINYEDNEDLIKSIPYFARKLKEISLALCDKRESLKNTKLKYNLITSNLGVEKLLYDYVLKGFTQRSNAFTQVPTAELKSVLPDLEDVKDHFYIEIEELYDSHTYFDSDPEIPIEQYVSVDELFSKNPSLNEESVLKLLMTRMFPKVAPVQNSLYYKKLTENLTPENSLLANNLIDLNKKYLGEPVYSLTATRIKEELTSLELPFEQGNNWFYWPSGEKILDEGIYDNQFKPILINDSNFYKNGATAGDKPSNSDLIYVEKNGIVEGAWLNGVNQTEVSASIKLFLEAQKLNEFIFPYVGYKLDPKTLEWSGHSLTNFENYFKYDLLDINLQNRILQQYYFDTLPLSSCQSVYLNNTNLNELNGKSATFSDEADVISKRENLKSKIKVYSDYTKLPSEEAFLYKPNRTDLPIQQNLNQIYWPYLVFDENYNIPINCGPDTCQPIELGLVNPNYPMAGAICGYDYATSDVIFKYLGRTENVIEAAWLGAPSITALNLNNSSIGVYNTVATKPAAAIDGPVQCSLGLLVPSNTKKSFIWCDQDTYADEVFTYKPHSADCEYGRSFPHDYNGNLNRVNPKSGSDSALWNKCTCKSTIYSPIGHDGDNLTDFNGSADYLFADPDGLGEYFLINNWSDTRNLNVFNSPQFAYYQLDKTSTEPKDSGMGWGPGSWKTGSGTRMVLKTGQRYTYYRSSFKTPVKVLNPSKTAPYFVINYPYKNVQTTGIPGNPIDLCIIVDNSGSQTDSLPASKDLASQLIDDLLAVKDLNGQNLFQISLVSFDSEAVVSQVLTEEADKASLQTQLSNISIPNTYPEYTTNINKGLKEAYSILTTEGDYTFAGIIKKNRPNLNPLTRKKIILISDGVENQDVGLSIATASDVKSKNVVINTVNLGPQSNKLLSSLATDTNKYFDYQGFLKTVDSGGYNAFYSNIFNSLIEGTEGVAPPKPLGWRKAIKTQTGQWVGTDEPSDMVIRPGDFIGYLHRSQSKYTTSNSSDFSHDSISFAINLKLNTLDGAEGAKPFWGKMYNTPQETSTIKDNKFNKETNSLGGHIRYYDDYVPIHQPEVSDMILNNGDFIQYNLKGTQDLVWEQPITLNALQNQNKWKKLIFYKNVSNLKDLPLKNGTIDKIAYGSNEDSSLLLQEFSLYKKTFYNYYARQSFTLKQELTSNNNCFKDAIEVLTAVEIAPVQPYANLANRFYPTVASVNYPELLITERKTGYYLTPEKLGVSTFRGRGFENLIDPKKAELMDQNGSEILFLSPLKYGSRNRGLTKKDQISPVYTLNTSSSWMFEPLYKNKRAGVYKDTLFNQKLIPYQSSYEILNKNIFGISRQDSNKLINQGDLTCWKVDEYGNDFGLYKFIEEDEEEISLAPVILSQPVSFTAPYNTTSALSVVASALKGPLYYYWYKNNELFQVGTSSLIFDNLQMSDSGSYQVYVKSLYGAVLSQISVVAVLGAPQIYYTSSNVINKVGSSVVLEIGAYNATSYQWYKQNSTLVANATTASLTIENSKTTDSGNYYCIASNQNGSVTSNYINLDIGNAPGLIIPMVTSRLVRIGSTVVLNLSVSGDEPLTVKWYNYGATLTSNIIYNYPFTLNKYNAVISNKYGSYNTGVVNVSGYNYVPGSNEPEFGITTYNDEYIIDYEQNYITWQ